MGPATRGIGSIIRSMVTERRHCLTGANSRERSSQEPRRASANSRGPMVISTKGNLRTIISMVTDNLNSQTVAIIKATSMKTVCTESDSILGLMDECTWVGL